MAARKSRMVIVDDDVWVVRASEVVAWLNQNKADLRAASVFFGTTPSTISRALRRGGYRLAVKRPWEAAG